MLNTLAEVAFPPGLAQNPRPRDVSGRTPMTASQWAEPRARCTVAGA